MKKSPIKKDKHTEDKTNKQEKIYRCERCIKDPIYIEYHDEERWRPIHDDAKLFEFLVLESFQAGLSRLTILKKRENFRKAFANFDAKKIAKFDEKKYNELMQDAGIVRNRLKIQATINNAQRFLEIQKEFGSFDAYVWSFTKGKTLNNKHKSIKDILPKTEISDMMSKDMGKRGFKFRGTTICYAFMQAVGIVNDHIQSCRKKRS